MSVGGGVGLLMRRIRTRRRGARIVIAAASVVALLAGALVVNAQTGWVHTLRGLIGYPDGTQLSMPARLLPRAGERIAAPRGAHPAAGRVERVEIPSAHRFRPRPAWVYLPPAALGADAGRVRLPVVVMMTGQPGDPVHAFEAGHLDRVLDRYAARHHGLAPILVVPDQLQRPDLNPMCVDSPIGDSYSYLADDVPAWIDAHLPVIRDHRFWAIGGYSQGGTCAAQLGLKRPDLFPTFVDISGELAPTKGAGTVRDGFGGSEAAYRAEQPLHLLRSRSDWSRSDGMFAFGELDSYWGYQTSQVRDAAAQAGMATQWVIQPGVGHSWRTVWQAFGRFMPDLGARLGLQGAPH